MDFFFIEEDHMFKDLYETEKESIVIDKETLLPEELIEEEGDDDGSEEHI